MSLDAPYDPANIFAKILNGAIPAAPVYEDDRVFAFMDAFPQALGHTLVIPKVAACNLFDIPADDLQYLILHTRRVAQAVRQALAPDGIRIAQFSGVDAGQTVFHLHFHIIPAWKDQPLRGHAAGRMVPLAQLQETADLIKAKLS